MSKRQKGMALITSLVTLLPLFFGLLLWDRLPDPIPTHWGISGEADGFSSRKWAVFLPPFLMLLTHWLCLWLTTVADRRNKNQNRQVISLVFWICPVLSLAIGCWQYAGAFGISPDNDWLQKAPLLFIEILFLVIGICLPNCRQNRTIGIRVKWTLEDEENWNATHRYAGKVWTAGSLLMIVCTLLLKQSLWIPLLTLLCMAALPILYSWRFSKKQGKNREGTAEALKMPEKRKRSRIFTLLLSAGFLAVLSILLFCGELHLSFADSSFTIDAPFWADLTVDYDSVSSLTYRDDLDPGRRTNGFGSFRLLMGQFENDELGPYTRYSYTACKAGVVLQAGGNILVISAKNDAETRNLYETLRTHLSEALHAK